MAVDAGELKQLARPWKAIGRISWLKDGGGILTIAADHKNADEGSQIWMVAYPGGEVSRGQLEHL
jgi:hypothetical protein